MTIARNGLRSQPQPAHTRTRSASRAAVAILASGGCAKQDSAPPTASADATAAQSSATAPTSSAGCRAAEHDSRTFPRHVGLHRRRVSGDPNRRRTRGHHHRQRNPRCGVRDLLQAAQASSPPPRRNWWRNSSARQPTTRSPHPRNAALALAAGRLVFQDRPVSYLRCAGEAPPPPVELAEPIEAPPATAAQDVELKVPDYMTPENFVNFTGTPSLQRNHYGGAPSWNRLAGRPGGPSHCRPGVPRLSGRTRKASGLE